MESLASNASSAGPRRVHEKVRNPRRPGVGSNCVSPRQVRAQSTAAPPTNPRIRGRVVATLVYGEEPHRIEWRAMSRTRRIGPDARVRELAAEVLRVVEVVAPLEICTYRFGRDGRSWESGLLYNIDEQFPAPPLRPHVSECDTESITWESCADCADFVRFHARYEQRCRDEGLQPLPIMVAPADLSRTDRIPSQRLPSTTGEWLSVIATMVETGRPSVETASH